MPGNKLMLILMAAASLALALCAHTPPPPAPPPPPCQPSEPIRLSIAASPRLNPGENGESLATTVRVYQLKDPGKLEAASLDQVLDNDRALIGDDLLSVTELTLYPGETARPSLPRREGVLFLAVVAFFRHPSGSAWRVVSKVAPPDADYCRAPDGGAGETAWSGLRFGLVDTRVELH